MGQGAKRQAREPHQGHHHPRRGGLHHHDEFHPPPPLNVQRRQRHGLAVVGNKPGGPAPGLERQHLAEERTPAGEVQRIQRARLPQAQTAHTSKLFFGA